MRLRPILLAGLAGVILAGSALAEGTFVTSDQVFSGVAGDRGEGLILPHTLLADADAPVDVVTFDAGVAGRFAMVSTQSGGPLAGGLDVFPLAPQGEVAFETRIAGESFGGFTPYLGVGVNATPNDSRVFQGIATLLPYEGDTIGLQGIAGIAFEFMPGLGGGIEYRYQGYTATAPVAGDAGDNQTIMMRLDLGLN